MGTDDFVYHLNEAQLPEHIKTEWRAPSNIALVKYWGKKQSQIPANPSISFTLDACATRTSIEFSKRKNKSDKFQFDFSFEGKPKPDFKPKMATFFERIRMYVPFLEHFQMDISSSNTFPHSSGIASSASGMAALALCIMDVEKLLNPEMTASYFKQKASFLARLGSGSACRSLDGQLVQWGTHPEILESSNLYGAPYTDVVHPVFHNYHDTILLVHKGEKQVSSTVGHNLMHNHPYAVKRFEQASENLSLLKGILKTGDLEEFMGLVESEALTLHAMMMTSRPYFMLMKPHTLEIIHKIWDFRKETKVPLCFTLDAGANVHLLYPESSKEKAMDFIKTELVRYCENGHYICDRAGLGARKIV